MYKKIFVIVSFNRCPPSLYDISMEINKRKPVFSDWSKILSCITKTACKTSFFNENDETSSVVVIATVF